MANFEGTVPTKQGLNLIGKVGTGVKLNFTRVAVGSGVWSPEQVAKPAAMTGLIKEEMTLAISPESIKAKEQPEGDEPVGCYSMRVMLTNSGLASGFALREIGIYATDPDLGEILYAVDYAGDLYDYIPALPANAAPLEKIFNLDFLTGTAKQILVNQSPVLLATVDDIGDHNTDPEAHPDLLDRLATGIPEILTPADGDEVGETPLFTFRPFSATIANTAEDAIQLQVDLVSGNFGAPIHDTGWLTTIDAGYELPATLLVAGQNIYKSRVRRRLTNGLISPWSDIPTMTTKLVFDYVDRAKNVSPSPDATGVGECPTFVGNAFSVSGDTADTHEATRGFILKSGVVLYETGDLGPVTQFTPPPGYNQVSGEYEWQIQYKGAILGWGEKSAPTRYYTAAAFITGDEAVSFDSWNDYDNASAAGVALADDAALYSNGVDQDTDDGDWTSIQSRMKIRGGVDINLKSDTTATELVASDELTAGMQVALAGGIITLGDVTESSIDEWNQFTDISPADWNNKLIAGNKHHRELYAHVFNSTADLNLYKSIDNGVTWSVVYTFTSADVSIQRVAVIDLGYIVVATSEKVWISNDNGETFTCLCSSTPWSSTTTLNHMQVSADGHYIYVGTNNSGIYYSNDHGATFQPAGISLSIHNNTGLILNSGRYVTPGSNTSDQIAYTDNHGETWTKLTDVGLSGNNDLVSMAEHTESGLIFVGGYPHIYASTDGGLTWFIWFNGITDLEDISYIYYIRLIGDYIYASTGTGGDIVGLMRINVYTKEAVAVSNSGRVAYGLNYNGEVLVQSSFYSAGGYVTDSICTSAISGPLYSADISAAGLTEAPTRACFLPQLLAATGAESTAFTTDDFSEIDIDTATLGTDTDEDRPDFMLLTSAKTTPASTFRRVAIGVSGLSEDSECRIAETQCDTWMEG
ncbi:hypothetical protein [Maridesulfovibrio sp.]|uniref:hypothetical protein n=1 Tax=Maridesulfovibrio sp. TaxID=2795000 RepID=UPI002AA788E2|nr:hypothetical protein [Maridesulfovibrio sp.]